MGTTCTVAVYGLHGEQAKDCARYGQDRLALLEKRWSRFIPHSEISQLNATAGQGPRTVSADTAMLVSAMLEAWEWTESWCDSSVLPAVVAAGYDADLLVVQSRSPSHPHTLAPTVVPGLSDVQVNKADRTVTVPSDVQLDPGGIGKGLAGDIVADEIMSFGAQGVLVDVGGDVVLSGSPGEERPWMIRLPSSHGDTDMSLESGRRVAVATSSVRARRWAGGHHLIDPQTGMPSATQVYAGSAVAPSGWQAEAAAKVAVLRPDAASWFAARNVWGRTVWDDGRVVVFEPSLLKARA